MMEKIEKIKQHASVEELQAMLLKSEKSIESRAGLSPKHSDRSDGDVSGGALCSEAASATPQTKNVKGKAGRSSSKAKPPTSRAASVPLVESSCGVSDRDVCSGAVAAPAHTVATTATAPAASAAPVTAGVSNAPNEEEGISFILDGKFEQRPSTSACRSRVGIRERKLLPPPPSQFQANEMEFGSAPAALPPLGKRQKTSAAIKKPGVRMLSWLCFSTHRSWYRRQRTLGRQGCQTPGCA
jgi:hypothetical protein